MKEQVIQIESSITSIVNDLHSSTQTPEEKLKDIFKKMPALFKNREKETKKKK
jgi:hypothetical protein